jgi:hypothetical protein
MDSHGFSRRCTALSLAKGLPLCPYLLLQYQVSLTKKSYYRWSGPSVSDSCDALICGIGDIGACGPGTIAFSFVGGVAFCCGGVFLVTSCTDFAVFVFDCLAPEGGEDWEPAYVGGLAGAGDNACAWV